MALTRIGASPGPTGAGLDGFLDRRVVVVCRHLTPEPSGRGEAGSFNAEWLEPWDGSEPLGFCMLGTFWQRNLESSWSVSGVDRGSTPEPAEFRQSLGSVPVDRSTGGPHPFKGVSNAKQAGDREAPRAHDRAR